MTKSQKFHFEAKTTPDWIKAARQVKEAILDRGLLVFREEFEVEIRPASKKRSDKQLKAYWALIRLITDYMNEQGNLFSPEEVSSWVKIQAGHYHEIEGEKIARSIANKSDATVADMRKIIEFILAFGIEHNIRGCEISNAELDALLRFYETKPRFKKGDKVEMIADRRKRFTIPDDVIIERLNDSFIYRLSDSTVGIMEFEMEAQREEKA